MYENYKKRSALPIAGFRAFYVVPNGHWLDPVGVGRECFRGGGIEPASSWEVFDEICEFGGGVA